MAFQIRPARPEDQEIIVSFIRQAKLNPRSLNWERFLVAELDGKIIGIWKNSHACAHSVTEPGVYRVEAWKNYLGLKRGWVFSNPIYVR